jgi:hypothetical protein
VLSNEHELFFAR